MKISGEDSDFFGNLLVIIGGVLISFAIVEFVESLVSVIQNYWVFLGAGYLIFSVGFYILKRNKKEALKAILYLLIVIGLISLAYSWLL